MNPNILMSQRTAMNIGNIKAGGTVIQETDADRTDNMDMGGNFNQEQSNIIGYEDELSSQRSNNSGNNQ